MSDGEATKILYAEYGFVPSLAGLFRAYAAADNPDDKAKAAEHFACALQLVESHQACLTMAL